MDITISLSQQLGDIWKDREKIEKHVTASDCPSLAKKRCIVRDAKLDQACHVWFLQQRQHHSQRGATGAVSPELLVVPP